MTGCGLLGALLAKAGNAVLSFYPPAKAGGNSTLGINDVPTFYPAKAGGNSIQ
jgi:hypothetical protein